MFIANSNGSKNVTDRHSTLFTVAIEESTLSYKMLFFSSQQDVISAMKRRVDCLFCAFLKLAGFVASLETI